MLGPGTLLLYNRTVYREHGGQTYPATADPLSNIVRLGDLGYVDGAGKFRPLLNIFDESGSDCEGSLYDILMHKENRTDSDIAPLTTYQSDSFTLSATTHMRSAAVIYPYLLDSVSFSVHREGINGQPQRQGMVLFSHSHMGGKYSESTSTRP